MSEADQLRHRIAEHLIMKQYRHIERAQAGALGRYFKTDTDEVRRAAILADRLRRLRQCQQFAPAFKARPVAVDAPIVLSSSMPSQRSQTRRA